MPFLEKTDQPPIILIGFQEQDNLGLGYVAATLVYEGFQVRIIDYQQGSEKILGIIKKYDPLVIGFSIIFQYHIFDFRDMLNFLRDNGVRAHISAGGHYPSLRHNEIFKIINNLDSVVLFEGEYTFLELVKAIYSGNDWKKVNGIAFGDNNIVKVNKLRPLEIKLDNFPVPLRPPLKDYALGFKYATLLAGRGCYYDCAFCSIRQFYEQPEGPVKRIRDPEFVAEEMKYLYDTKECRIFMFQDDDFPVNPKTEKNWIYKFCTEIANRGLKEKILWKINCRPDEIEKDSFIMMKEHGLFIAYLGIENGTDEGLKIMNKHINRDKNIEAVNILKELDIYYDFGFMLFHPWSTLPSITENLNFLKEITGDGSSPVTYCKLLPYAETKIEKQLAQEGRLTGLTCFEDYNFLDKRLDTLFNYSSYLFSDWINSHNGILNTSRWAKYTSLVMNFFYSGDNLSGSVDTNIKNATAASNLFIIETLHCLVNNIETITEQELREMKVSVQKNQASFYERLESSIVEMNKITPGINAGAKDIAI